jgi:hypothetical protein
MNCRKGREGDDRSGESEDSIVYNCLTKGEKKGTKNEKKKERK